jgi:hypothetical protein
MSPPAAWKLMDVYKNYSADDVLKFGHGKLGLVLQAPEEVRPSLMKDVASGATKRELEAKVQQANAGKETIKTRQGVEKKLPKEGSAKPGRKPSGNTITIANILGDQTVTLYKKESMKGDKKDWIKAKRAADVPCAVTELENGVVQTFTVMDQGDGTWKLRISTKRIVLG